MSFKYTLQANRIAELLIITLILFGLWCIRATIFPAWIAAAPSWLSLTCVAALAVTVWGMIVFLEWFVDYLRGDAVGLIGPRRRALRALCLGMLGGIVWAATLGQMSQGTKHPTAPPPPAVRLAVVDWYTPNAIRYRLEVSPAQIEDQGQCWKVTTTTTIEFLPKTFTRVSIPRPLNKE
jgi:hypothetical protein